jgi:hypothetical protein
MAKLVQNEQRKLSATYLNGIAIALITVGVLAPIVALLTGALSSPVVGLSLAAGCIVLSFGIHSGARQILKRLEE